jgi:hypothetical protein
MSIYLVTVQTPAKIRTKNAKSSIYIKNYYVRVRKSGASVHDTTKETFMKKRLILAAFGLLASLAMPAFGSDSPGTNIDAKAESTFNQQTFKENMLAQKTFVIAGRVDKAKDVTAILATSRPGAYDTYLVKRIDTGPTAPGLITASPNYGVGNSLVMISAAKSGNKTPTVGLDLKTASMTSARAAVTSTTSAGVEITLKI